MAEQEEDLSGLPLTDRFTHKVWKHRQAAYEEAAKEFEATPDESHPAFRPFLSEPSLWKGAVADSNVAAQASGITSLCAFLKFGGKDACTRTRGYAVAPIVEKGLSSTKAATKQSSLEALLLYVELDKADPIVEEILAVLSHKQPKVIAAALNALTSIIHAYGVKIVDPKQILKALPKVFGHADKNVRAESSSLVVELYRWLREAIKPMFWSDLKPVQQQDLEKLFEGVKQEPHPKQERLLRSQQEKAAAAPAASGEVAEDEEEEEAVVIDAFDLAEPVDVLAKMSADFFDGVGSTKWMERKTALEGLLEVAQIPRIKDGPYDETVSALAKCMKDANVAVVTVAAQCVEALAKGLRKAFSKYRSRIQAPIMERLKEKKQSVADALGAALDGVFTATSLSDCLEETLEFLKHKNPQVKQGSTQFLIRALKTTRDAPSKLETKSIAEAATKLLTESTEVMRSAGAEVLGTLMKIMGERQMGPYMEGLDDIRKTKIKECFDAAVVKAKDKPPKPKPAPAPAAAPAQKRMVKKAALGAKKAPAPARAASPALPVEEPLKPIPTARSIPSKLSGLSKPTGGPSGLKLPGKKTLAAPPISSPRRPQPAAPLSPTSPDPPPAAPRPTLASARSLTNRPLSKPQPPPSDPAPQQASAPTNALSIAERAELTALRTETADLQTLLSNLRAENSRLAAQIAERENNEAQLIEERTRNVLSIKAKETQLVRARADAQAAEELVAKQGRELDRLRKELGRKVLEGGSGESVFRDASTSSYGSQNGALERRERDRDHRDVLSNHREIGYQRAKSYVGGGASGSPSSEKENSGESGKERSPPPTFNGGAGGGDAGRRRGDGSTGGNVEGVESWRRAAEVTSQLRAKIEMMKARQGGARMG